MYGSIVSEAASLGNLLVVEDDLATGAEIVKTLQWHGYNTTHLTCGTDAIAHAVSGKYHAMTLDRMLPDADGVMIVRSLRESGCTIPVLILSSLSDVDDRVRGLRAGGDDYLTKPYHADELLVRVQALIRRSAVNTKSTGTSLKVGDLELDLLQRVASRSGRTIALVPAEFKLLSYMMEHKGRALTREMIFEAVWGYRFDPGTNTIDVHIARLRKKLELPGETRLLHTVRNEGYVIDQ